MLEPIDVALLVVEALEELDVSYAIGGSLASALYGTTRSTLDADLIAELRPNHVKRFVKLLNEAFYVDEVAVREAIGRRRSFNLVHLDSAFKVDVFIPRDRRFDRAQLDNATMQIVSSDPERLAKVLTAEDTILAKLEWYRLGGEQSEQQWRDIMGIIAVQGERLDKAYLEAQAAGLGVEELLHKAFAV